MNGPLSLEGPQQRGAMSCSGCLKTGGYVLRKEKNRARERREEEEREGGALES